MTGCGRRKYGGHAEEEAPAPDVSGQVFSTVSFGDSVDQYKSKWSGRSRSVEVSRGPDGGLKCHVVATAEPGNHYGGVKFAVPSANALRLELSFTSPNNIVGVFVDGSDQKKRLLRWSWVNRLSRPFAAGKASYVLVPGKAMGYFFPAGSVESDGGDVRQVDIFIAINPNTEAGFTLYKAEYAAAK
jgi:hypothetical protein